MSDRSGPEGPVLDDEAWDVAEAVDGGEDLGELRRKDVALSLLAALRHTHNPRRVAGRYALDLARIGLGRPRVDVEAGDRRFADPTWDENAVYRTWKQVYLATCAALDDVVEHADVDWRNLERARFAKNIVTSTLAPTNTLPGNPKAIKHALDSGGASLVRGVRNFVSDLRHNGGMPSQVDRDALVVGRDLALSPGAVVHRGEMCEVIRYRPATPTVRARPIVMAAPQINRFYFLDLRPGRSFVEFLVGRGYQVFVISWRNPTADQAAWGLDDYAGALIDVIDVARDLTGSDDVNLLAMCAGGILSAATLGHLAAEGDERVHTVSFGVTLLDFDVQASVGMLASPGLLRIAERRSATKGVLDAAALSRLFVWLRPNDLVWTYWVNNYLMGERPPTFDVLAWNADGTNLPGRLHAQFLELFMDNALVVPNRLEVLGTAVDLSKVRCESYVTGALTDHLTPWQGCYRTTQLLGGPSTFVLSNAGHIQSIVNPPGNPRAHYLVGPEPGPDPDAWLAAAETRPGSWWEHWADWLAERSGEEVAAPDELGDAFHPVLGDAPGTYVFG